MQHCLAAQGRQCGTELTLSKRKIRMHTAEFVADFFFDHAEVRNQEEWPRMSENGTFRFAIADTVVRSECWTLFFNGNDVYLTGSAFKRELKISLHQSGVCQAAFLKNFHSDIAKKDNAPITRDILRWKRTPTPQEGGKVAVYIQFASYEDWPEAEAIAPSKPYKSLAPPPFMSCRTVTLSFSREDPRAISVLGKWGDAFLYSKQIPSGEFVCLMQHEDDLPWNFFDFEPVGDRRLLLKGIDEAEADDARGINCLDFALTHEGCVRVHSLHNMRLKAVRR